MQLVLSENFWKSLKLIPYVERKKCLYRPTDGATIPYLPIKLFQKITSEVLKEKRNAI